MSDETRTKNLAKAGITETQLALMFTSLTDIVLEWRDAGVDASTCSAQLLGVAIGIMKALGAPPRMVIEGTVFCLSNYPSHELAECVLRIIGENIEPAS